ncbi:MAG: hypothetical protein EA425_06680, partial [Puniceicoccaceae bacterium]
LHHAGDEALNLAGWGLSDQPDNPFRWVFPEVVIAPGGYLLVWADGKDRVHWQATAEVPLIESGEVWRYRDDGSDLGADWRLAGFDDTAWAAGTAPLGYGPLANYVETTISFGGDPANKHIVTYFRRTFTAALPTGTTELRLSLWVDDGAVVYLNGEEVVRENLPPGPVTNTTLTPTFVGQWPTWNSYALSVSALVEGENVLAVQVHQYLPSSSDLAFDLQLAAVVSDPELHANFSLSSDGDWVVLTAPDGTTVDAVAVPLLPRDVSYGRSGGGWAYFSDPTPRGPNTTTAYEGLVDPPTFSVAPGFHPGPVALELHHPDPNVTLRYTTDGSAPAGSGSVYQEPLILTSRSGEPNLLSMIPTSPPEANQNWRTFGWLPPLDTVAKARVVRAVAEKEGYLPRETASGTWFVGPELAGRYAVDVVSLIAEPEDLFGHERGILVPGQTYQQNGYSGWWGFGSGNYSMRGRDWERPVHFEFFDRAGGARVTHGDLHVRTHGNATRVIPQKALRLYDRGDGSGNRLQYPFFDDPAHAAHRRLLLRHSGQDWWAYGDTDLAPTMFKDAYLQRLVSHLRFDWQAYRPTVVFLNGEYWGIHNLRERIDRYFVAGRFGVDPERVDLLNGNAQVVEGSNQHYQQMMQFVQQNDLNDPANYAHLKTLMDVDSYLDYLVAQTFLANDDWPGNNIRYWRLQTEYLPDAPPGLDGRWRWIVLDLDFASNYRKNLDRDMFHFLKNPTNSSWPNPAWSVVLVNRLWTSEAFVAAFANRYADHLNTTFQPGRAHEMVDAMEAALEQDIVEHFRRWGRNYSLNQWRGFVERLRMFARDRPAHVWSHLNQHFNLGGTAEVTLRNPQPERGHLRINGMALDETLNPAVAGRPAEWSGLYFRHLPVEVEAVPGPGYRFAGWEELSGEEASRVQLTPGTAAGLTAVFEEALPTALIHYWSFNAETVTADYSAGGAVLTAFLSVHGQLTYGTGQGFVGANGFLGEPPGDHLRLNHPLGSVLRFHLPTTGVEQPVVRYETRRSGQGAGIQELYYTVDGSTFLPFGQRLVLADDPRLQELDFSGVEGVDDNPDFAIEIRFAEGLGDTAGNNRFDNLSLEGIPLPGTNLPPVPTLFAGPLRVREGGEPEWVEMAALFSDPDGDELDFTISMERPAHADVSLEDGFLRVQGQARGESIVTLTASDGHHPPVARPLRVLVHPAPHALRKKDYEFTAWDAGAPEGVYPPHLLFLQSAVSDPNADTPLDHAYHIPWDDYATGDAVGFPYNNESRTRINGLGDRGIAFINTGRGRDLGGALLALDTRGVFRAAIEWTAGTETPNSRVYELRCYYRVGTEGPFLELPTSGASLVYLRSETAGHEAAFGPVGLPPAAIDQPLVELLWRYQHVAGTSGPRAALRLDDIRVSWDGEVRSYGEWVAREFPDFDDRINPALAGPAADPNGSGLSNLQRYALDPLGVVEDLRRFPELRRTDGQLEVVFPFHGLSDDVAIRLLAGSDLLDWQDVWWDSRTDPVPAVSSGLIAIVIPEPDGQTARFFRLETLLLE